MLRRCPSCSKYVGPQKVQRSTSLAHREAVNSYVLISNSTFYPLSSQIQLDPMIEVNQAYHRWWRLIVRTLFAALKHIEDELIFTNCDSYVLHGLECRSMNLPYGVLWSLLIVELNDWFRARANVRGSDHSRSSCVLTVLWQSVTVRSCKLTHLNRRRHRGVGKVQSKDDKVKCKSSADAHHSCTAPWEAIWSDKICSSLTYGLGTTCVTATW